MRASLKTYHSLSSSRPNYENNASVKHQASPTSSSECIMSRLVYVLLTELTRQASMTVMQTQASNIRPHQPAAANAL